VAGWASADGGWRWRYGRQKEDHAGVETGGVQAIGDHQPGHGGAGIDGQAKQRVASANGVGDPAFGGDAAAAHDFHRRARGACRRGGRGGRGGSGSGQGARGWGHCGGQGYGCGRRPRRQPYLQRIAQGQQQGEKDGGHNAQEQENVIAQRRGRGGRLFHYRTSPPA